ncbi:FG-GAP repeat domain-containing protein [uncultured Flavonifractor sp.]|uniref:FG-GAP repeat domain-containing protein n=1 Tax=uncultured Flavonifractor sp. TaxID=1193534 RepID=UPI002612DAEA|nr:VCBS repeat-containing protein [uncultured Flavonifractor sp.]
MGVDRRIIAGLLAGLLALGISGCRQAGETPAGAPEGLDATQPADLTAGVLHGGEDGVWQDTLSHLSYSSLANLTALEGETAAELAACDMLIADPSLLEEADWAETRQALMDYARAGGLLVLDNCFWDQFPAEFLGISGGGALEGLPAELAWPEVEDNLTEFQQLLRDFAALYPSYYNAETLAGMDYGWGFTPTTARAIALQGELALYTLNDVGEGQVLLTNPMLPNRYSITSPSLTASRAEQEPFANTSNSANRLFYGKLLAYQSMEKYGYALERVYGPFATNPAAWELHYEEITAIREGSAYQFAQLAEEAGQIPSFTLVRDAYWWLLRAESVTYLVNQSQTGLDYDLDEVEGIYSSGTHVVCGGDWLSQVWVENTISYFSDEGGYTQRAYPTIGDVDGDGADELLCGSGDGRFYCYELLDNDARFSVEEPVFLTDEAGEPLLVSGGHSAPAILDVDGDGVPDVISGAGDGKLYWLRGVGGLTFEAPRLLLEPGMGQVQTFPETADMDGDGAADLLVGSAGGGLALYRGRAGGGFGDKQSIALPQELTDWAAPCAVDLNGDGTLDIALGTFHGYVARLERQGNGYTFTGYFQGDEENYKGNTNLKFGNNCKPVFYDVNGDGALDLICGQLEYGLPCPIDSEYFPFREQLQEQVDWMEEKNYYLGVHSLTHWYASEAYEQREFARSMEALASYGVDLSRVGTNQHTWHTSVYGPAQTFLAQYDNGMLWNSGAEMPCSAATPQTAAENVLSLPFFLEEDGTPTMLMLNASTLFYKGEDWQSITARYGTPVLLYYHCDWIYRDDAEAGRAVQAMSDFMDAYGYTCIREDQLAYASAAAVNTAVTAGVDAQTGAICLSASPVDTGLAMYDERYQSAVGVKLTFGAGYAAADYTTDASVWRQEGNSLYLSLDRETTVWKETREGTCLRLVNLPAGLSWEGDTLTIDFAQGGLMEVVVEGSVSTPSQGWTMTREGERTTFTKRGDPDKLVLHFWE